MIHHIPEADNTCQFEHCKICARSQEGKLNTRKLGLWVVWHDRNDNKDPNRFPVVELAGHVMLSLCDQHDGTRRQIRVSWSSFAHASSFVNSWQSATATCILQL